LAESFSLNLQQGHFFQFGIDSGSLTAFSGLCHRCIEGHHGLHQPWWPSARGPAFRPSLHHGSVLGHHQFHHHVFYHPDQPERNQERGRLRHRLPQHGRARTSTQRRTQKAHGRLWWIIGWTGGTTPSSWRWMRLKKAFLFWLSPGLKNVTFSKPNQS